MQQRLQDIAKQHTELTDRNDSKSPGLGTTGYGVANGHEGGVLTLEPAWSDVIVSSSVHHTWQPPGGDTDSDAEGHATA